MTNAGDHQSGSAGIDGDVHLSASVSIHPSASVGAGASIGEHCVIEAGARVGAGAQIGAGSRIGPNAVLESADGTQVVAVRERVRVGANSTVVAGVTISTEAVVRPGAVVTRSVPPRAIVEGNPATIIGYVETESVGSSHGGPAISATQGIESTQVRGVTLHRLPLIPDLRGNLTVGEFARDIPFVPQRYFMVFSVPNREVRGEHAHRECHQFLICVRGSCSVVADDGERRVEVLLDAPEKGLYLPPMTWGIQYRYSNDAVLLVFASHHYDAADYIRDYAEYLAATAARD